jgi:4-hydroxy-tetrahydrodipicolinate synthase
MVRGAGVWRNSPRVNSVNPAKLSLTGSNTRAYGGLMSERSPGGILTAVVTPFRADETIDYDSWRRVIEFLIAGGIDGLFVLGGGGEFYALNEEERKEAARFAVRAANGRLPIYANVGAVTTRETVMLAQHAEAEGVDYVVAVTPYYIRPSADELVQHYSDICKSVRIPVFAYNIPARTGVELTPLVVRRISESQPNFIGLKDSSGRIELTPEWVALGLTIFMGSDHLIQPALELGCVGAVTVCSNVAPRLFADLFRACKDGNAKEAARLQALAAELRLALKLSSSRSYVKEAMSLSGMPVGLCRRPAGLMAQEERTSLDAIIGKLREYNYLPAQTPA